LTKRYIYILVFFIERREHETPIGSGLGDKKGGLDGESNRSPSNPKRKVVKTSLKTLAAFLISPKYKIQNYRTLPIEKVR